MKKAILILSSLMTFFIVPNYLSARDALVPVSAGKLASIKSLEAQRSSLALSHLRDAKTAMGLQKADDFLMQSSMTDGYGQSHIRFQLSYKGIPVFGSNVIAHVGSNGDYLPPTLAVKRGIDINPVPVFTPSEAVARARDDWCKTCAYSDFMKTELIVWPQRARSVQKITRNPGTNQLSVDVRFSTFRKPSEGPYALAYYISMIARRGAGLEAVVYIIDAHTGVVLDKWNAMKNATPFKGTGRSQYSGIVAMDTALADDGANYQLTDMVRPDTSRTHPVTGLNFNATGFFPFDWEKLVTIYGPPDLLKTVNDWGDGFQYDWSSNDPTGFNGQTTAVDAHFNMGATWDFYKNVLGRNGIDGKGTPSASCVHFSGSEDSYRNAFWVSDLFMMFYGDGDGNAIGGTWRSLTSLDVVAHEISHGVMFTTSNLFYGDESGGLNESNSDVYGKLTEFYLYGQSAGSGAIIPDTAVYPIGSPNAFQPVDWTIGREIMIDNIPLRYMYKPSNDGWGYDFWFDGVGWADVHDSSGVGNRFAYFLSNGAAANESDYYTKAFPGIGNDKLAKIWYRTITTKIADVNTDYHEFREAFMEAAIDMYGPASQEVAAARNAFAAVNVGEAADGSTHPQVIFPRNDSSGVLSDYLLPVADGTEIALHPEVKGASSQDVDYKVGSILPGLPGGSVSSDGVFRAPLRHSSVYSVTATSREDPLAFGAAVMAVYNLDVDDDFETDACDMGVLAQWYDQSFENSMFFNENMNVSDNDIAVFLLAYNNSFVK